MKKIQSFTIKELRNEEDFGFHLTVIEEAKSLPGMSVPVEPEEDEPVVQSVASDEGSTPALTNAVETHATKTANLDTALKESVAMESVAGTDAADAERDRAWSISYAFLKAMLSHPDAEKAAAADVLYKIFMKYGNITHLPQMEESGAYHNLLQDLKAVDTAIVEMADFTLWLNLMETTANAYLAAAKVRTNEKSARITGWVKDARKEADDAFRLLIDTVNSHVMVFGEAPYATFIDHMNTLIDDQKTILKTRKTNAAKKKDEETSGETTPDENPTPDTPTPDTPTPDVPADDEPVIE